MIGIKSIQLYSVHIFDNNKIIGVSELYEIEEIKAFISNLNHEFYKVYNFNTDTYLSQQTITDLLTNQQYYDPTTA